MAPVVLVALEVDDAVLDEAAPPRRRRRRQLTTRSSSTRSSGSRTTPSPGRLALRAAREGVAVIAAHTSLDKARGGMADVIAELLDLEAVVPLAPAAADALKLVGFVPADDADLVRKALFAAGAGVIGEYEHCSWSVGGQGTFFGREGTDPAAGRAGRDETVDELRIEVVFPRRLRRRVTGTYVAAHPYEEPAYDIDPAGERGRLAGPRPARRAAGRRPRWRRWPRTSRRCCGCRRCATPATAAARCAASPCCPAPAPRPSRAASPRSPTCSSPATSSTTRRARRRPRAWP